MCERADVAAGSEAGDDGVGDGLSRGIVDVGRVRAWCAGGVHGHVTRAERRDRGHVQHDRGRIDGDTGTARHADLHAVATGHETGSCLLAVRGDRAGASVHESKRGRERRVHGGREVAGDVDDEVGRGVGVDRHRATGTDSGDDGVGDGLCWVVVDVGRVRALCAGRVHGQMAGVEWCDRGHVQHHRRRVSGDSGAICDLHDHRRVAGSQPHSGVLPIERGATGSGVHQATRSGQQGVDTCGEVAGNVDDEVGRGVGVDRHPAAGADSGDDGVGDGLSRGIVDVGRVRAFGTGRVDGHMARAERRDRGHVQHHRRRISGDSGAICDLHDHRRVAGSQPHSGVLPIERGATGSGVHQATRRTQRHVLRCRSSSGHVNAHRHRRRTDQTNEHGQRPHSTRNPNPMSRTHPDHLRERFPYRDHPPTARHNKGPSAPTDHPDTHKIPQPSEVIATRHDVSTVAGHDCATIRATVTQDNQGELEPATASRRSLPPPRAPSGRRHETRKGAELSGRTRTVRRADT